MPTEDQGRPMLRLLLLLMLLAPVATTYGDEYRKTSKDERGDDISANDPTVCSKWGKNLNHFAAQRQALSCERPIAPTLPDLSRPRWQALDPREHIDLLRKMDRMLFYDLGPGAQQPFVEDEWRKRLDERLLEGSISLSMTEVSFSAADHKEKVVRYAEKNCTSRRGQPKPWVRGTHYFVVNGSLTALQQVTVLGEGAELFLYRGQVYAEWVDGKGNAWVDEFYPGVQQAEPTECQRRFMPDRCPAGERPSFNFVPVCRYLFSLR